MGPRVVVIGAGFGGLASRSSCAGPASPTHDPGAVRRVGGVWRDNTYPGAACDVPSALYSWSFARNPDWSRRYARPGRDPGLLRARPRARAAALVRTGCRGHRRDYDGQPLDLLPAGGYETDVLVSAVGQLSARSCPDPGPDSFDGPAFHSAPGTTTST